MPNIGVNELVLILALALILFGLKELPELAKGVGKAIREFKKVRKGVEAEIEVEDEMKKRVK